MVKFAGERGRKNALEEQMSEARYIGHHPRDGSMMVITDEGVKKAVGFRRLPGEQRWSTDGWANLKGLPWDVTQKATAAPRAAMGPAETGPDRGDRAAAGGAEKDVRPEGRRGEVRGNSELSRVYLHRKTRQSAAGARSQ